MKSGFIFLCVLFAASVFHLMGQDKDARVLPPQTFASELSAKNGVLLDVRTPDEYKAGHLPDATNVDFFNPQFKEELKKLDKENTYFVYCRSGKRSAKSAAIMEELGFKLVYDLKGGFLKWQSEGMTVEKE